jgi:hypothetical protein
MNPFQFSSWEIDGKKFLWGRLQLFEMKDSNWRRYGWRETLEFCFYCWQWSGFEFPFSKSTNCLLARSKWLTSWIEASDVSLAAWSFLLFSVRTLCSERTGCYSISIFYGCSGELRFQNHFFILWSFSQIHSDLSKYQLKTAFNYLLSSLILKDHKTICLKKSIIHWWILMSFIGSMKSIGVLKILAS